MCCVNIDRDEDDDDGDDAAYGQNWKIKLLWLNMCPRNDRPVLFYRFFRLSLLQRTMKMDCCLLFYKTNIKKNGKSIKMNKNLEATKFYISMYPSGHKLVVCGPNLAHWAVYAGPQLNKKQMLDRNVIYLHDFCFNVRPSRCTSRQILSLQQIQLLTPDVHKYRHYIYKYCRVEQMFTL